MVDRTWNFLVVEACQGPRAKDQGQPKTTKDQGPRTAKDQPNGFAKVLCNTDSLGKTKVQETRETRRTPALDNVDVTEDKAGQEQPRWPVQVDVLWS